MMVRDEIAEYPYNGVITRTIEGDNEDTVVVIYDGVMDETMMTDDEGRVLQTASYVISIPLTENSDGEYIIPVKGDDSRRIGSYFDLLWEVANSPTCQQMTLNNLLSALLSDLYSLDVSGDASHAAETPTAAERLMQRFFDLLAESDGTVRSVKAFADRLCVSPNHLSAVVKQQSGQTVMQLLNAHTVLHAKILLRHSTLPLADIADRLGFENPPAFSRFFKRETGVTASSVRNMS